MQTTGTSVRELGSPSFQNVIDLQSGQHSFIARYRKELHGAMDDTALRDLEERLQYLRNLAERREAVKRSIEEQGKLTAELSAAIDAARTLAEVEDLYRPYKSAAPGPPLPGKGPGAFGGAAVCPGPDCPDPRRRPPGYVDAERAWRRWRTPSGASDIIAETICDDAALRKTLRTLLERDWESLLPGGGGGGLCLPAVLGLLAGPSRLQGTRSWPSTGGEKEGFL